MGDSKETDGITITYDSGNSNSYSWEPTETDGTFTVKLDSFADTEPYSIYDTSAPGWTGVTGCYVDTDLVKSNPTCKALWEQFTYVYEMIKSDKENNEEKDDIPF